MPTYVSALWTAVNGDFLLPDRLLPFIWTRPADAILAKISRSGECPMRDDNRARTIIGSPLSILCVGAGRDGTTSITQMLQSIFKKENKGRSASHEWGAVELYQMECAYRETGDSRHLEKAKALIGDCPYHCIVGNGYAPFLSLFAEIFGSGLVLIRVRRRDRAQCIDSLVENALLFPDEEWESWPLERRFGWYYDKTHAMIDGGAALFRSVLKIETQAIDSEECRRALGHAVKSDFVPSPARVNQHVPLEPLPMGMRPWVQHLLGTFDVVKFVGDEL
jgi:hypothetical protein